ncbi:MAG: SHOCT domain-containing protein [Coriobacteriia bacterium]
MMGRNWDYGTGWDMMGGGGSAWVGVLMFVFGLIVLVGIVLLVIWAVRASNGHGGGTNAGHRYAGGPGVDNRPGPLPPTGPGADEAIAVARRRFAAGEISQEEFAQIMSSLSR